MNGCVPLSTRKEWHKSVCPAEAEIETRAAWCVFLITHGNEVFFLAYFPHTQNQYNSYVYELLKIETIYGVFYLCRIKTKLGMRQRKGKASKLFTLSAPSKVSSTEISVVLDFPGWGSSKKKEAKAGSERKWRQGTKMRLLCPFSYARHNCQTQQGSGKRKISKLHLLCSPASAHHLV